MTNPGEIKSHISAISQTRQITNAMYLLSASRLRQTIKKIDYNLLYMRRLRATIKDIIEHTGEIHHTYIDGRRHRKNALYIVISGDKGLCGSYNNDVLNFAERTMCARTDVNTRLALIGMAGEKFFQSRGIEPDFTWRGVIQEPAMYNARAMTEIITEEYNERRADEIYVIYTHYKNSMVQEPAMLKLLPLSEDDFSDVELEYEYRTEIEFVPSPEVVFGEVVPQLIIALLFNTLIQSSISENAARMNAMQTATTTADEMIQKLEFEYNQQRQLAITNEITEIAAATQTIEEKAI